MAVSNPTPTERRARRTRTRLKALAGGRPRLSVFRSAKNIYAQIIDDAGGVTLAHASSLEGGKDRSKDNLAIKIDEPTKYKCWAGCSKDDIRAACGAAPARRF